MQYARAAVLVAGLAAQQAAAFGWTDAGSFSCPGNTPNQCSPQQQGGYNWSGLQQGSFNSYGSNQFTGFQCSDNPSFGKRDILSKRGFQNKCITGSLDSNPSMSCNDNEGMSIDQMQISSSQDTEIDCEYGMPDGSTCHEIHSCSQGGSIFQNSQCGGAKSVTFKPGPNAPPGCSIGVHSVGFHCGAPSSTVPAHAPSSTVPVPPASSPPCNGPQCSPSAPVPTPSMPAPTPSSPAATPSTTAPVYTCVGPTCSSSPTAPVSSVPTPPGSTPPCYGSSCNSATAPVSSVPAPPGSTAPGSAPPCYGSSCNSATAPVSSVLVPSGSAPACYGSSCTSTSPVVPIPSSSEAIPVPSGSASMPCYGGSCGTSSTIPAASTSATVPCYGSSCSSPVVPVPSSSGSAPTCYGAACSSSAHPVSSAPSAPCYGSACGPSQGVPSSSSVAPVSSSSAPGPYPTPNCPGLLPRCLNTWMFMSGCKDNADSNCFCGSQEFITKVMGCISAWGGSASEVQAAASYLMGLCASHVSTNPAIITACPSTVTPAPTPAGIPPSSAGPITSAPPAPGRSTPCTTITYSSSVVIPATFTTGVSSGLTCPGSSITTSLITTVTVPQVQITTNTVTSAGTTTQSVGLGAGAPAPADATTTGVVPGAPGYPTGAGTTFGTSWGVTGSATGSQIVPFTGAGVQTGSSLFSLILGAIAALAAL